MSEENQTDDPTPREKSEPNAPDETLSAKDQKLKDTGDSAKDTPSQPEADTESQTEASDQPDKEAPKKPDAKASAKQEKDAPKKAKTKSTEEPKAKASSKPKEQKKEEGKADDSGKEESADKKQSKPKEETAEDLLKAEIGDLKIRKAKGSKNIVSGIVHILATFNNTLVTFTDKQGNVISWSSSGKCNFRGSRKSTAYAAQIVTQDAGRTAMSHGLREVEVRVKGPGMGRDSAVRALQALGLNITSIVDVTPVPHNGCRPPKRRRV